MEITELLQGIKGKMAKVSEHIQHQLNHIQAHKITQQSLDLVKVNAYESYVPISQVARVNIVDTQTLSIQPYEKHLIQAIENAVKTQRKDHFVRHNKTGTLFVSLPTLTEERRKKLVNEAQQQAEQAKIHIRNKRIEAKQALKKMHKEGTSEDKIRKAEEQLQKLTSQYIQGIEDLYQTKERSLMTV